MMKLTVKQLRDAIHLLDDDEVVYIEQASNVEEHVKGAFDYMFVPDDISGDSGSVKGHFVPEVVKYLYAFTARWVMVLDKNNEETGEKIFVIEVNY